MNEPVRKDWPLFRLALMTGGLVLLVLSAGSIPEPAKYWPYLVVFGILSLLAKSIPAHLPGGADFSVAFVIDLALISITGLSPELGGVYMAVTVAGATSLLVSLFRALPLGRPNPSRLSQALLTANAQVVVAVYLAGLIYNAIGAGTTKERLVAFSLAYLAYILLDTALLALNQLWLAQSDHVGANFPAEWLKLIKCLAVYYVLLAPLAYFMSWMLSNMGQKTDTLFLILLFFVPLMLVNHSVRLYMNMRRVYLNTIRTMAATVEAKDHYTRGHSERVADYAQELARALGYTENEQRNFYYLALLHDMGKIGISEKILHKPGPLDADEYGNVKLHAEVGAGIVEKIKFLKPYANVILHHHERFDGYGYPAGLYGEFIPLGARILAVADAYDAMTSDRPYREAKQAEEAAREMVEQAGRQFDPKLVEVFMQILRRRGEVNLVS